MTEQIDDAETYEPAPARWGGSADPPDEHRTVYATIQSRSEQPLLPIVPAWARNPGQRREVGRWAVQYGSHVARYHASRLPKYAGKVAFWAPVGLVRLISRQLAWWWVLEQHSLRQGAAQSDDAQRWLQLHHEAKATRAWRGICLLAELVAAVALAFVLAVLAPWWMGAMAVALIIVGLARLGRPAGKPITDRVAVGPKFVKLTAEQVRGALCSIGVAKIKEPGQLSFPAPGIHRDGPGWLARVNLPEGVDVADVLERRSRLSSALRLPVDQVWPAAGPEHAGQLDLWVGYAPASKMGQPRWSLAAASARTSVFRAEEFGTDERQRPVRTAMFANNFLVGGRPGSGKSFAARTLVTIAAMDPSVELKILEYKGTGDFLDFAPLCSTYVCGLSDADFRTGHEVLRWALAEAERRGERIRRAYERGEAPERKVTPELAARPGSGLHPIVITFDEAHELFGDSDVGKECGQMAERLVKRGRALGIIVVIATQIPDKDSLPTGITRNMGIRWCLAVPDQIANDMILGTGAYKRGLTATIYRPAADAGWGVLVGLADVSSVRSHFPDAATAKALVARATVLRGGIVGQDVDATAPRDVLADILAVFSQATRTGLHWQQLVELLASAEPDWYASHTAESLSALCRAAGIPSVDVKAADGSVRKGTRRADVLTVVQRRAIGDGSR